MKVLLVSPKPPWPPVDGGTFSIARMAAGLAANLTFNPTEFSRLRAQFDHGALAVAGVQETYNQFFLQFQMSLGAHGAHRF